MRLGSLSNLSLTLSRLVTLIVVAFTLDQHPTVSCAYGFRQLILPSFNSKLRVNTQNPMHSIQITIRNTNPPFSMARVHVFWQFGLNTLRVCSLPASIWNVVFKFDFCACFSLNQVNYNCNSSWGATPSESTTKYQIKSQIFLFNGHKQFIYARNLTTDRLRAHRFMGPDIL